MKLNELPSMTIGQIEDFFLDFSMAYVTDCEVELEAFFAGVRTWLTRLVAGEYPSDALAVEAIGRHLHRWLDE